MLAQVLLSSRQNAKRHERVIPRRIGFADLDERDAAGLETRSEGHERAFIRYREHDSEGVGSQVSRAAFACCVHQHGALHATWDIGSGHNVMGNGTLRVDGDRRLAEITVVGRSWKRF